MPTYVTLHKLTAQGSGRIEESPSRVEAARKIARELGGELKALYPVMGRYDFVGLLEAPDDETAARVSLAFGRRGNVSTETLRAFTEADWRRLTADLP
ncbi:MAG TPA: GYD domain-containing protein [Gemmatimonadota bacterium]|jgi:uncharacterized protein with GYD domain